MALAWKPETRAISTRSDLDATLRKRDRIPLPDREAFIKEVNRTERQLNEAATTLAERDSARRRAVEQVLLDYGLMKNTGDVSHNFEAAGAAN